jgi:phosphoribosylglycinamide formyltransferase-1
VRLAVLASGTGSIYKAIVNADVEVAAVLVDRHCPAIDLARADNIPVLLVERHNFAKNFDRDNYSNDVVTALKEHNIEVVAMAGFGTILGAPFFEAYEGRVLNTHPSLLPSFPGWHAVNDALQHGVRITGCTVHIATLEVDAGPILAQSPVEIRDDDDETSLHERIKLTERDLYPATIKAFLAQMETQR